MIKYIVTICLISLVGLFGSQLDTDKFYEGEQIYRSTCAFCHGVDGKADLNIDLIVRPRSLVDTILTQEQSYKIIKHGARAFGAKSDIMPAFKYVFNEEQLNAVSYYISKNFNPNVKQKIIETFKLSKETPKDKQDKMLEKGKKIYKRNCSWCHGINGHGDGLATKNPINSIFPYDLTKTLLTNKQMFLYVKYGGRYWGTYKDDMPSWKIKYSDYILKSVVKYVDEVIRKKKY